MAAFYLDSDVSQEVARFLQDAGHEASTARSIGLGTATDDEQLMRAAEEGWILVTHNREDYKLLHGAWLRWSRAWQITPEHAGILVIPQPPALPYDRAARELAAFVRSGHPLTNALYLRHRPGVRPAWERWQPHLGRPRA